MIMCFCLLLACAACQGAEPETTEPSAEGGAAATVPQDTGTEPTRAQSEATDRASQSAGSSEQEPVSATAQRPAQAVALFSAKQAGAIDRVVYRANIGVISGKPTGKTYELKTQAEMAPVLEAVQQKVWTPTGDSWAVKQSPSLASYTLLLQENGDTRLELGLCGDLERAGYVAVKENGKLTRYEVPVATYQQLLKAHTFA